MASQFEKRKQKEQSAIQEIVEKRSEIREKSEDLPLPHLALDIIVDEKTQSYQAVFFAYDLDRGIARIEAVKKVPRTIALTFQEQKRGLQSLLRLKQEKK